MATDKRNYSFGPATVRITGSDPSYRITGNMGIEHTKSNGKVVWLITIYLNNVPGGSTKIDSDSVASAPTAKAVAWTKMRILRQLSRRESEVRFSGKMSWH